MLAQNEAVRLFVARAQAAQFDFALSSANASTIVKICRQLDGLPLAIELAAARVRLLPPTALLARLARRLDLLAVSGRDQPARQQTMRNAIAWSYDLLDQAEQALCRRVAVFAGGFMLAAAQAVAAELKIEDEPLKKDHDYASSSMLNLVEALVDKSLLLQIEHAGEPRFMMLETIREYGLEQLVACSEIETTRLAHAHYYLALAEEAAPRLISGERDTWLDRLAVEHDNMRAALAWSQEDAASPAVNEETTSRQGATDIGLRLAAALTWFWILRCHFSEGRRWLNQILDLEETDQSKIGYPCGVNPKSKIARALYGSGILAMHQGDYTAAAPLLEQALAIFRATGDQQGIGRALMDRGYVAYNQGDYAAAGALLEESLPILQSEGDTLALAHAFSNLGLVAWLQADYVRAQALHQESLNQQRQRGDTWGIAGALGNLGLVAWIQGDYAAARAYHEESLSLRRELGDKLGVAYSLSSLGLVRAHQGDYAAALAYHEESLSLRRELGFKWGIGDSLRNLGHVAQEEGEYGRAAELLQEGLALFQELGAKKDAVECLENLAAASGAQGQATRAARLYGAAEALREIFDFPRPPLFRIDYERSVAALHTHLAEQAFAATWMEGRVMALEEAITYALSNGIGLASDPQGLHVRHYSDEQKD
jgi:predicted ATPase